MKFVINSVRTGQLAFGLIGYGGLPSNHSAIVCSMAALIAMKEGIGHTPVEIAAGALVEGGCRGGKFFLHVTRSRSGADN